MQHRYTEQDFTFSTAVEIATAFRGCAMEGALLAKKTVTNAQASIMIFAFWAEPLCSIKLFLLAVLPFHYRSCDS